MQIKNNWNDNLKYSLQNISVDGLVLEFGVSVGKSIKIIAETMRPKRVYGFDSFIGLPEPWDRGRDVYDTGHFAMDQKPNVPANVVLVEGFFEDSLEPWLNDNAGQVAFLHIDCDLYSASKYVLTTLNDLIVEDTIIVFDEYCDWQESGKYENWRNGEYKAYHEWIEENSREAEMISRDNDFAATFKVLK